MEKTNAVIGFIPLTTVQGTLIYVNYKNVTDIIDRKEKGTEISYGKEDSISVKESIAEVMNLIQANQNYTP